MGSSANEKAIKAIKREKRKIPTMRVHSRGVTQVSLNGIPRYFRRVRKVKKKGI